jgi:hypothetical protein
MRSKKEWAELYATMGLKVFPCHTMTDGVCSCGKVDCTSPAKHPRTRNGCKDASRDLEQVRKWWEAYPAANIGLATGTDSGVWVLDLDGPEGCAALAELERKHGKLPETAVSKTAKGEHYFFRVEDGTSIRNSVRVLPEIDTRGDGGYVIVPQSTHSTGVEYLWASSPEEVEIAPAPAWLLELVSQPKRSSARRANVDDLFNDLAPDSDLRTAPGAPEGQRHSRVCALVGSALGRNVPLPRLTALALAWGMRCEPPMDNEEILQVIESLSEKDGDKLEDLSIGDGPAWPMVRPEAFHGLAGDIVHTIEPETEADSMSLLLQLLVVFGATIGRKAHCLVESTRHYANLFVVIVGATASARKGTSFDRIRDLFRDVSGVFPPARIVNGLSSGEGLIWTVRDPIIKDAASKSKAVPGVSDATTLQGVSDKRLIAFESEFASVLSVVKREGNTLSPVLREAWQSGNLDTLVKHSPAKATNAHISVIGHITLHELRTTWPTVEGFNGFANRFLWAMAQRSKLLPDGGRPIDLTGFQQRLADCINFANQGGTLTRDEQASKLWHDRYPTLGTSRMGTVASVIARAQPQVVRLSMLFALLDLSMTIRRVHLAAAFAVWDYCEESAVYIFGETLGNRTAERILSALRERCRTTKELHKLFNNRLSATDLKTTLEMLLSQRLIRFETHSTGGRPSKVWHAA